MHMRESQSFNGSSKKKSLVNNPNFQGLLVLAVIAGIGLIFLWNNSQPSARYARPPANPQAGLIPTRSVGEQWQDALQQQLENPATSQPSPVAPATIAFVVPTLNNNNPSPTPRIFRVTDVVANPLPTLTPLDTFLTPTVAFLGSTPIPSPTGFLEQPPAAVNQQVSNFAPPAARKPPLSLQPYDHFFFQRPVDASANGESLFYYPYGSTGQVARIHHGIDIPNPVGEPVYAGNSGTVVWADSSLQDIKEGTLEVYASYGNVVVIEHDFSVDGQKVWTLYAHLSAILVERGERVTLDTVIGLVGDTGIVTGPHVHFEVRVGVNDYWNTRNPLLWIVPYLNHGVIAGRVVDSEGRYIDNAIVQINRAGRRVDSTATYTQPKQSGTRAWHVVPDNNWRENFVFGDVPAGDYEIVVLVENRRFTRTITVRAEMVNWIEFQLDAPAATPFPDQPTPGSGGE